MSEKIVTSLLISTIGTVVSVGGWLLYQKGKNDAIHQIYENGWTVVTNCEDNDDTND